MYSSLKVHNIEHLCRIIFLIRIKDTLTIGGKDLTSKATDKQVNKEQAI